jgi:transcriptional regulator with XRE-family HTH domain
MMRPVARSVRYSPREERLQIGPRLRAARQARGLTIEQLADATGVSKGFVSRLERDEATPSVASLVRACDVLGIKIGSLFDDAQHALVRRADATPVKFGGSGVEDALYTPTSEQRLQVLRSQIEPLGGGGEELYTLPAEVEFVYVISGRLEVRVGADTHVLGAGDGLTFSPREPHTWRNPSSSRPASVLWVISPAP